MTRHAAWLIAVLLTIGVGAFLLARNQRGPAATSPPSGESGYRASDPARFAATGRPQLVEFFHHA